MHLFQQSLKEASQPYRALRRDLVKCTRGYYSWRDCLQDFYKPCEAVPLVVSGLYYASLNVLGDMIRLSTIAALLFYGSLGFRAHKQQGFFDFLQNSVSSPAGGGLKNSAKVYYYSAGLILQGANLLLITGLLLPARLLIRATLKAFNINSDIKYDIEDDSEFDFDSPGTFEEICKIAVPLDKEPISPSFEPSKPISLVSVPLL